VNSSSQDGTLEYAKERGVETLLIPRHSFNHGLTRERARKTLGTQIIVMMTPDAFPTSEEMLSHLLAPLLAGQASMSYARQLPHKGAGFLESFSRIFNYPSESHVRELEQKKSFGSYTSFFSDSCAAYLNSALEAIGGFQECLLGEDTLACSKILKIGGKVAYVAEAKVYHSHSYSLKQEFQRFFDTGLMRQKHKTLLQEFGSDHRRGMLYLKTLIKELFIKAPHLIPYACLHTGAKYLGYLLGRCLHKAPPSLKRKLSSQDFYWDKMV